MRDYKRGNWEINHSKKKWQEPKMKWRDRKLEKNKVETQGEMKKEK